MPRTAKTIDPIEQLQKEAKFGRAIAELVKEHGMVKTRRYTARRAKRAAKASTNGATSRAAKKKSTAKKSTKNPLARVRPAQPSE